MWEVDLVGFALTWLALVALGSRPLAAAAVIALGEVGRVAAVLVSRGELTVLTSGGLFSRWEAEGVAPLALAAGAAALPLLAGWALGRGTGHAAVRYAVLTALVAAWRAVAGRIAV